MKKPCMLGAVALLAAGCGGMASGVAAPQYDAATSATSQAATFIEAKDGRPTKAAGKAFLSECNVLYGIQTSASAETSRGLLPSSVKRVEAKSKSFYHLKGMDAAGMQALADAICDDAARALGEAGYEVIARASLAGNERFQKIRSQGKPSPYEMNLGAAKYNVYSATGASVFNPAYLGTMGGLSMALKQAKGESPWLQEGTLAHDLGASAVRGNIVLDFSSLQSSDSKWDAWASKDTATISGEVKFAASGSVTILSPDTLNCYERLGMFECMGDAKKQGVFTTRHPLTSSEKFYTSITDATTVGDTVASVVSTGLAILGGGGSTLSVKRTDVNVDPDAYVRVARGASEALVDMALTVATK